MISRALPLFWLLLATHAALIRNNFQSARKLDGMRFDEAEIMGDKKTRRGLDLDMCAKEYPAFLSYLNRRFGKRSLSEQTAKVLTSTTVETFVNITPGRNVSLEVKQDIGFPMILSLRVLPNKTVVCDRVKVNGMMKMIGANKDQANADKEKTYDLIKLMNGVLHRHGELVRETIQALGGEVRMVYRGGNSDAPANPQKEGHDGGLPLHGYSSERGFGDIAMPDFTFQEYPEIRSTQVNPEWTSNNWFDVKKRLQVQKYPKGRKRGFIFRGRVLGNDKRKYFMDTIAKGPPETLKDKIDKAVPDGGFDVADVHGNHNESWMSLYDQCRWRYTVHLPGTHYSAMLKYKLACGQVVFFMGDGRQEEFWYDALKHGKNIFFIPYGGFWDNVAKLLASPEKLDRVAAEGQHLVNTYLSQQGIDCYVMLYLARFYLPLL